MVLASADPQKNDRGIIKMSTIKKASPAWSKRQLLPGGRPNLPVELVTSLYHPPNTTANHLIKLTLWKHYPLAWNVHIYARAELAFLLHKKWEGHNRSKLLFGHIWKKADDLTDRD